MKNTFFYNISQYLNSVKERISSFTVKVLRQIISYTNKHFGLVFIKANFGKTYSDMRKEELVKAILLVLDQCDKWEGVALIFEDKRIMSSKSLEKTVFKCLDKFQLWKMANYVKGKCSLLILKEEELELVVFNILPKLYHQILRKARNSISEQEKLLIATKAQDSPLIPQWMKSRLAMELNLQDKETCTAS
jgi:hypothetical protein